MRSHLLISLTLSLLVPLALALARAAPLDRLHQRDPSPQRAGERVGIAFGRPDALFASTDKAAAVAANKGAAAGAGKKASEAADEDGETSNYLVTLERTVTNAAKDKILDFLLRSGAIVKQVYDYRVFKGVLFTIPSSSDKGLTSWQSTLGKQDGVKYVEEDSVVKIQ
ncbi:hypothetical protein JCM5296_003908 [Sporobolomyces johnsonii]